MVRTQIQLTEEQYYALKRIAEIRKVSMAELIRRGVDEILRSNVSVSAGERKERALALAGRFRSGRADISGKHDEYLGEDFES